MIRELTIEELPILYPIGHGFYKEGSVPGSFVPEVFQKSWTNVITLQMGAIFAAFQSGQLTGALGCLVYPDLNNARLVSMEAFWYVFPEFRGHGIRLMKHYEAWAISKGVKQIGMAHLKSLNPDQLGDLYTRMGYRVLETIYIKQVP